MKKGLVTDRSVVNRDYRFDNIKLILISLVVLGHLLELVKGTGGLYKFIYSFHMPVFIFVTGRFAKFDIKNILCKLALPYIFFQVIYLIFEALVLKGTSPKIQFTKPYWLLWYLFAIIIYYLIIPLLPKKDNLRAAYIVIAIAILCGLLIGFVQKAGYYLSISRIVVFFPFFLLGYYSSEMEKNKYVAQISDHKWLSAICLIFAVVGSNIVARIKIPNKILYGSYSYEVGEGRLWMRLLIYVVACFWIYFLVNTMTDKKLSIITVIGQNTLPIFLLHGFIVKLLKKYDFFRYGLWTNLLLAGLVVIIVIFAFGIPWIKIVTKKKYEQK